MSVAASAAEWVPGSRTTAALFGATDTGWGR
jgi:hypothetical protein